MQDTSKQKKKLKRALMVALIAFLILILALMGLAAIVAGRLLSKINRVDPNEEYTMSSSEAEDFWQTDPDRIPEESLGDMTYPTVPYPVIPGGTEPPVPSTSLPVAPTTVPTQPPTVPEVDVIFGDHLINIMLVGQDRREGQGRQRSDTMILVSINKSDNTITLTSFMRDMYVQIPGYKPNKLNAAYAFGGMGLLRQTLEVNFGVKVDGVVEVDFGGFNKIIDLLGGVEVELTEKEAKYLNDLYDANHLKSPVVVGKNRLDAKQAQVYVQLREIDSDYSRAGRQRKLISSIINAYREQPLDQMLKLLEEILPYVTTDMTNLQILDTAVEAFPLLASARINNLRIPLEGTYDSGVVHIRDGFYAWLQYNVDFEANRQKLYEIFRRKN